MTCYLYSYLIKNITVAVSGHSSLSSPYSGWMALAGTAAVQGSAAVLMSVFWILETEVFPTDIR